ncbi:MAG: class I SAM-dependent methyltransferase [Planctomycetaceae bacterium]
MIARNSSRVTVPCPICGPANRIPFTECSGFPIVRCCGCRLLFVGEAAPVEQTQDFFRSEHITDEGSTQQHYVDWRKDSLAREAAIIRRMYPDGGRLLDVGAASGFFLHQFQNQPSWEVTGVEPSCVSTAFARKHFGLRIHNGYLHDAAYSDETFDVVTSLDSFTCHREPAADLREIHRILNPGGLLAIEIGGLNFRLLKGTGILCRLLYGRPARLNAGVNYFYYNRTTLTMLAESCGFNYETSFAESMPTIGSTLVRAFKQSYFHMTAMAYRWSNGRASLVPKEFILFRKPGGDSAGRTANQRSAA